MRVLAFCAHLTVVSFAAFAQEQRLTFEHLGTSSGLSQNSAFCVFQDSQGFLWVGTQNGLNRFDGYTFTSYHHNPLDSTSISDSYIVDVVEDKLSRLWIRVLSRALNIFSRETGTFARLVADPERFGKLAMERTPYVLQGRNGDLWFLFQGGKLARAPAESLHLPLQKMWSKVLDNAVHLSDNILLCMYEDTRGSIWIGGTRTLLQLRPQANGFTFSVDVARRWDIPSRVFTLTELSTIPGYLWIGMQNGLRLLNMQSGEFVDWEGRFAACPLLRTEWISCFAEVAPDVLWIGTGNRGMFELNTATNRITHYVHNPVQPAGLSDNRILAITPDRSGVIWLGTLAEGLSKTLRDTYPFRFTGYTPGDHDGLHDNDVTALLEDRQQTLWVGTRKGGLHKSRRPAREEPMRFTRYPVEPANPRGIRDPYIKALHEDRRGNLWVGLWAMPGGGLLLADTRRESFTAFTNSPSNPHSLSSDLVRVVRDDAGGYLWVGSTHGGLSRIHLDSLRSGRFTNYLPEEDNSSSLSMNDVFSIVISKREEGDLWLSTFRGGINRLDRTRRGFTQYRFVAGDSTSLCDDRTITIYEDRSGNIWVGTFSGLALLPAGQRETGEFQCFDQRHGLPHNYVQAIQEDRNGNLWISTQTSLSRFTPRTGRFVNFHAGGYLPITEFNANAACTGAGGRLYFGGVNGFIAFDPESIRINTSPPPVVVTSVKVFEKEAGLDTAVTPVRELRLSHEENFLSFEFAALDFREPERNQYAYRMEGITADWVQIGNRRYASFSNLEPKEYLFRVKASNNDGIWNDEGTAIRIVITPPFWMTAWFRAIAAGVLLAALTGVIRSISTRKLRQRLHQLEVRERVREERERISSELHDHIGANLTNLATGLEVSQRFAARDVNALQDNLAYLERHARSTIEALRETIWSLQNESGSVGSLVLKIEELIENHRRLHARPVLRLEAEGDRTRVLTPTQTLNLYRICQEGITNALKHAHATEVHVELDAGGDMLTMNVLDNGIGFASGERQPAKGYGLSGMRRRAARIGARIDVCSTPGAGTHVSVTLRWHGTVPPSSSHQASPI